jgi:hypothetical protein
MQIDSNILKELDLLQMEERLETIIKGAAKEKVIKTVNCSPNDVYMKKLTARKGGVVERLQSRIDLTKLADAVFLRAGAKKELSVLECAGHLVVLLLLSLTSSDVTNLIRFSKRNGFSSPNRGIILLCAYIEHELIHNHNYLHLDPERKGSSPRDFFLVRTT